MTVQFFEVPSVQLDRKSVYRYLRCGNRPPVQVCEQIDACIDDAQTKPAFRVVYAITPVSIRDDTVLLGGLPVKSEKLSEKLSGIKKAVLFCASCGVWFDRKIAASRLSPSQAVIWDALGTAAIEQLCDDFCDHMNTVRPRFSPGYGDLALAFQSDLLNLLQADRNLGIGLTDSLLMAPTKSVTAIAALE